MIYEEELKPKRHLFVPLTIVVLLLLFSVVAARYYLDLQPDAILTNASLAINLSWDISDSDNVKETKIYRTTTNFLEDVDEQYFIANVPAPEHTYFDTAVSNGITYYYSIFQYDDTDEVVDASFYSLAASETETPPLIPQIEPPATSPTYPTQTLPATQPVGDRSEGLPYIQPPTEGDNFMCTGDPTVYFYYQGKKEAYSEPALFESWNGKNYASIKNFDPGVCQSISDKGLVRLPHGTFMRVPGGKEIYRTDGGTARPYSSATAFRRDSAGKTLYTVSISYLHTYSRGQTIK